MIRGLATVSVVIGVLASAVAQPAPAIVAIRDFSFEPHEIKIAPGTAVRWVNQDPSPHAIAMEGGRSGSSGQIAPGQAHTFTFQDAGTFTYRCGVHPTMLGVLIVGP